jgi:Zn-dependent protease with chaperone function
VVGEAVALLLLGVLLAEPLSRALARARWTARDPTGALVLWQAVGLAGGLSLLGAGLCYGLAPLAGRLPAALVAAPRTLLTQPAALGPAHLAALLVTAALAARLVGVLVLATARTVLARRRHRDLLDVLATPWPAMSGARVLAHPLPVAYCLPGPRSRLVLSEGILATLSPAELAAVLAHERTHLRERHDLVVLPFVAWGATAPWVPGMASAQAAVATLVEMRADDVAATRAGREPLAAALRQVGGHPLPGADRTLSSFSSAVSGRLARLHDGAPAAPAAARAAVRLAALALVAVPTLVLLLPL